MEKSLVLIYTGNGKGKTSACVGQSIRALGQGLKVSFVQFMKRNQEAGEQVMLKQLLGDDFFASGLGFFRNEDERSKHRQAALNGLSFVYERLETMHMLILDESLYALDAKLLMQEEVENLLIKSKEYKTHIVFSGRNAPKWLMDKADLVTEMQEIKHPWQQGIKASKGIEY